MLFSYKNMHRYVQYITTYWAFATNRKWILSQKRRTHLIIYSDNEEGVNVNLSSISLFKEQYVEIDAQVQVV
jgi:hypothetical protein